MKLSNYQSMEICRKLDRIAVELRKVSAEARRKVEIFTHVQKDGRILITVQPEECRERLEKNFWELQRITTALGKPIFFHADTNKAGDVSSVINALGYRKDHFFSGDERVTYGWHEIEPEQVVFGRWPIGLEGTILQEYMQRKKQKK